MYAVPKNLNSLIIRRENNLCDCLSVLGFSLQFKSSVFKSLSTKGVTVDTTKGKVTEMKQLACVSRLGKHQNYLASQSTVTCVQFLRASSFLLGKEPQQKRSSTLVPNKRYQSSVPKKKKSNRIQIQTVWERLSSSNEIKNLVLL